MIILLDTSTPVCRLMIVQEDGIAEHEWESGRTLAKGLLEFLDEKTGGLHQVKAIGAMKGPGSFTGLRIGLTVLNTLADSLSVPIVGETGGGWQERALERLKNGDNDKIVLPFYGSEAHITAPKR